MTSGGGDEAGRIRQEREMERRRIVEAFRHAPAAMALLAGPEHVFEMANPAYQALVGERDILGRSVADALPEAAEQGFIDLLDQVFQTGEPYVGDEVPVRLTHGPGGREQTVYVNFVYEPLLEADGTTYGILVHAVEVTALVEARRLREEQAERLRASEGRLRAIFQSAATGLATFDVGGRIVRANPTLETLTGRTEEAMIGTPMSELLHPDDRAAFEGALEELVEGRRGTLLVEHRLRDGQGEVTWVRSSVSCLRDPDGTALELVAVVEDVDERVRLNRRRDFLSEAYRVLAASDLQVESALRAVSEVAVPAVADFCFFDLVEDGGTIHRAAWKHADPAMAQHFDDVQRMVPPLSLEGHPVAHALATNEPEFVPHMTDGWMRKAAKSEEHLAFMRSLSMRSLVTVPLSVGDRPVGALTFAVADYSGRTYDQLDLGLLSDFGRRAAVAIDNARLFAEAKRARAEAEAARIEAETANRAKSEFLAVMSHELRTPLNAIGGYVELIEMGIRGPVTDEQRADLHRIQESQQHLLGLIEDVINYARLESGSVTYDIEDIPAARALASTESLVAPMAQTRGVGIEFVPAPPELMVHADPERLRQVLVNLASNAVKFTPKGGWVRIATTSTDDEVRFTVEDNGVGIPDDRLEDIFEPFVQVRGDLARPAEGTGLGLAISRDLARGMGGELTVESTLGSGSTFTLSLPRGRAAPGDPTAG